MELIEDSGSVSFYKGTNDLVVVKFNDTELTLERELTFNYNGGAWNPVYVDLFDDPSSSESGKIDLLAIDANINLEGDQEFTFIGSASFTNSENQARFSDGILYLTTHGDADAEIAIELKNVSSLSSSDLVL